MNDERLRLALGLLLVALLWHPIGSGALAPGFLGLAGLGLLWPAAMLHPLLWLALSALAATRVIDDWPLSDNHGYLLAYWCLAIGLALRTAEPRRAVAWSGRALIGLVFLFALLWKTVWSPDFVSGDFLLFAWLTDPRFEAAASMLGGLSPEALEANRAFLAGAAGAPDSLELSAGLLGGVQLATWWTLALEAALAVCFLAPGSWTSRWRDPLLLVFCAVTYALAPVAGFAWLLLSMGLAQARPGRSWSLAYLAVAGLVLLYDQGLPA